MSVAPATTVGMKTVSLKRRAEKPGTVRTTVLSSPRTPEEVARAVRRWAVMVEGIAIATKVKASSSKKPKGRFRRSRRAVPTLLGTQWELPAPLSIAVVASLSPEQADELIVLVQRGARKWDAMIRPASNWFCHELTPLVIEIVYPLRSIVQLEFKPGRFMSAGHVVWQIARAYEKIYGEADATEKGQKKYGVWGHALEDLSLHGFTIDKTGLVTLSVGS